MAKTSRSQHKGPGLDPWSGHQIPCATTKGPVCPSEDLLQLIFLKRVVLFTKIGANSSPTGTEAATSPPTA